jgi:hypothetical protein
MHAALMKRLGIEDMLNSAISNRVLCVRKTRVAAGLLAAIVIIPWTSGVVYQYAK